MSDRAQTLEKCIRCGYSLQGHEGQFQCPECGFQYDEHTKLWSSPFGPYHYATNTWVAWSIILYFILSGLLGATAFVIWKDRGILIAKFAVSALTGVLLLIWATCAARARRKAISNPFIAVTPEGVAVSRTGCAGEFKLTPWSVVEKGLRTTGSGWGFAYGAMSKLGVTLRKEDADEMYASLREFVSGHRNLAGDNT